jgi:hypothetical protein
LSPPSSSLSGAGVAAVEPADDEYRLSFIKPARAPSGNAGSDWLMYRIAQGPNVINGYRRGDIASVTSEVEKIVIGLNERRLIKRRKE